MSQTVEGAVGIDVSFYQGSIDWNAVAGSGHVQFAYPKATEGNNITDSQWVRNRDECERVGIPWGGYGFCRPDGGLDDARSEARRLIDTGAASGPNPPVADMEATRLDYGATVDWLRTYLDVLHSHNDHGGRLPWQYSGAYFLGNPIADEPLLIDFPWILPNYAWGYSVDPDPHGGRFPSLNGAAKYPQLWQYTSSGRVPGIAGNVDMNVAMNGFDPLDGAAVPLSISLLLGDTRPEVLTVQQIVGAPQTGVYDSTTSAAVIVWQMKIGVAPADGLWGPTTARKTSEVFRYLATIQEDTEHMDTLVIDGREDHVAAYLLSGRWKTYLTNSPDDYPAFFEAAAHRGEGDIKLPPNGALQPEGSPWLGRLDWAKLTNPEQTPVAFGGTKTN